MSNDSTQPPQDRRPDNSFVGRLLICGIILFFALMLILFTGCSPRGWSYLHDGQVKHDSIFVSVHDSIHHYERDSIFIREKGDTIFQYIEHWNYRDRWHRDTLWRERVDSVFVDREKIVEVAQPLTAWQKWQIRGFWYLCGALVLLVAFWLIRKRLKLL